MLVMDDATWCFPLYYDLFIFVITQLLHSNKACLFGVNAHVYGCYTSAAIKVICMSPLYSFVLQYGRQNEQLS